MITYTLKNLDECYIYCSLIFITKIILSFVQFVQMLKNSISDYEKRFLSSELRNTKHTYRYYFIEQTLFLKMVYIDFDKKMYQS